MVLAATETKIRIAMMMQKGQWADDEYGVSVLVVYKHYKQCYFLIFFFGDLSI